ncbi:unnamed protein product [Didymodactylos carnosus]|uniref:Transmembrane protein 198 n=2 Tax=Didymodactylos carnosus TaxID=1234261 RepID=A0A814H5U0_9BILA|nr:unnamed protein product [Didymodactylos carnosus]CAF3776172.1 unnamed protein product [Didymodactylos carnosus]
MAANIRNISYNRSDIYCEHKLPSSYDLPWLVAYSFLAGIGLFYTIVGYRCWRLTMFITAFNLSSLLLYIILSSQQSLNEAQIIGISCSIAVLFGLIGSLLQYVGLFEQGFCFGLILSIITFIIWDFNQHITNFWIPIILIVSIGSICATITLRFQKLMIIVTSSCLGSVCHFIVLDYFLQNASLVIYIHKRLKFEDTKSICLKHWLVAIILVVTSVIGILIQYNCTGRNYDHRDSWQQIISAGQKRYKTANLKKIRQHYDQNTDTLREQIIPNDSHARFRYFYRIRRANGDVLSQDFIQNVRQQSVNSQYDNVINPRTTANPASTTLTTPNSVQKKDTDSTTTTLTHLT